jgi:nickel-type superoxide dismutase maturation protease
MVETTAWLIGQRRRVRVVGPSMEPTLNDGEFVLVAAGRRPEPGQLVVAQHPTEQILVVKRVVSWPDEDLVEVASDNPTAGTDSRTWGPLPASAVVGTVTVVLGAAHRDISAAHRDISAAHRDSSPPPPGDGEAPPGS